MSPDRVRAVSGWPNDPWSGKVVVHQLKSHLAGRCGRWQVGSRGSWRTVRKGALGSGWTSAVGAVIGAVIAFAGVLLAGIRTDHSQRRRDLEKDRLRGYVEFVLALDTAHGSLRDVARAAVTGSDRDMAAVHAVGDAGVYAIRERLLLSGSPKLVQAAEVAFLRLIDVRNAVRTGAALSDQRYHGAYHTFAESLWQFRMAARVELGQPHLTPAELSRASWSEREQCPVCGQSTTPP